MTEDEVKKIAAATAREWHADVRLAEETHPWRVPTMHEAEQAAAWAALASMMPAFKQLDELAGMSDRDVDREDVVYGSGGGASLRMAPAFLTYAAHTILVVQDGEATLTDNLGQEITTREAASRLRVPASSIQSAVEILRQPMTDSARVYTATYSRIAAPDHSNAHAPAPAAARSARDHERRPPARGPRQNSPGPRP